MPSARNFFTEEDQQRLVKAIEAAELKTSGEIRLHLENICLGDEVKAARGIFKRLKMHLTRERNGVLIYLAVKSRKMAMVGDEGIHQKLGQAYWDQTVQELLSGFKSDKKAEALEHSILDLGERLASFFPRQNDDTNELTNSISY